MQYGSNTSEFSCQSTVDLSRQPEHDFGKDDADRESGSLQKEEGNGGAVDLAFV